MKAPLSRALGSALAALLFFWAQPAAASQFRMPRPGQDNPGEGGGLEAGWLTLSINRDQINEGANQAGFPGLSSAGMSMWSGGVIVRKGQTHWGAMGMQGALASEQGSQSSNWGLDIVGLVAEQRYGSGGWEATAGFFAGYGMFSAEFRGAEYSRFEARFPVSGGTAGARWPTNSRLSFFIRSGYLWMPAAGAWHGDLAGKVAKTYYDLSAPFAQLGADLMF